ncbi:hypothetical protein PROFUN_16576, partial [Planoprotostelium fungivorum]
MVKVLVFKELFARQCIEGRALDEGELPSEIHGLKDGRFLVSTNQRLHLFAKNADSEYQVDARYHVENTQLSFLSFLPNLNCSINVVRLYSHHKKIKENGIEMTSASTFLATASSVLCAAVCTKTDRIATATKKHITVWQIQDEGEELGIEKIFSLEFDAWNVVTGIVMHDTTLGGHVRIIRVDTRMDQKEDGAPNHRSSKEDFNINFDDEGNAWVEGMNVDVDDQPDSYSVLLGSKLSIHTPSLPAPTARSRGSKRMSVISDTCNEFDVIRVAPQMAGVSASAGRTIHGALLLLHFKLDESPHSLSLEPYKQDGSHTNEEQDLSCFVSTSRRGYVFQIASLPQSKSRLLYTYHYTNESSSAVMTRTFLYLSTVSGLEVWTTRTRDYYMMQRKRDGKSGETTLPSPCLIGLQPYIGLHYVDISQNTLFLMTKYNEREVTGWNLYSLHLTPAPQLFDEFVDKADR